MSEAKTAEEEKVLAALKADISALIKEAYGSGVGQGHENAVSYVRQVIGNPVLADTMARALAMLAPGGGFNIGEALIVAKASGDLRAKTGAN